MAIPTPYAQPSLLRFFCGRVARQDVKGKGRVLATALLT